MTNLLEIAAEAINKVSGYRTDFASRLRQRAHSLQDVVQGIEACIAEWDADATRYAGFKGRKAQDDAATFAALAAALRDVLDGREDETATHVIYSETSGETVWHGVARDDANAVALFLYNSKSYDVCGDLVIADGDWMGDDTGTRRLAGVK